MEADALGVVGNGLGVMPGDGVVTGDGVMMGDGVITGVGVTTGVDELRGLGLVVGRGVPPGDGLPAGDADTAGVGVAGVPVGPGLGVKANGEVRAGGVKPEDPPPAPHAAKDSAVSSKTAANRHQVGATFNRLRGCTHSL